MYTYQYWKMCDWSLEVEKSIICYHVYVYMNTLHCPVYTKGKNVGMIVTKFEKCLIACNNHNSVIKRYREGYACFSCYQSLSCCIRIYTFSDFVTVFLYII